MDRPSAARPRKRARPSLTESEGSGHDISGQAQPQATTPNPSTRRKATTACVKCRARKTKCDNQRPSCGYCFRNDLSCVYDDDTSNSCTVNGARILEAIDRLSSIVERQQNQRTSCPHLLSHEAPPQTRASFVAQPEAFGSPVAAAAAAAAADSLLIDNASPASFLERGVPRPIQAQGIESILQWTVFAHVSAKGCLFAGEDDLAPSMAALPSTEYNELCRLKDKYVNSVHSKNPILDMDQLNGAMLQIAENGFDWSIDTCLVTLVCAIGAMAQNYQGPHMSPDNYMSPRAPQAPTPSESSTGSEPQLSLQFWNVAVKRLGLAIGQGNLQAAQCLCLAGIWYMHHLEPLHAWKYFNLAGSVWYTLNMIQDASGQQASPQRNQTSLTVAQALFFTIWKSICEVRLEIDVPGMFDKVELPHDFPLAPDLGFIDNNGPSDSDQRYWFYYLAEIAARHQINRIARAAIWTSPIPSSKEVYRMLTLAQTFELQLGSWHASLPAMFAFEIPTGNEMAPHREDLVQILRHRYLTCKELIARPFVWLSVETPCAYDDPLRHKILTFASQGLQYCMLKLSQVAPHRHQGTWFGLRNAAASTLLLCSVSLAQRDPWRTASRDIELPRGWQTRAQRSFEVLAPFWAQQRGGASRIGSLVQSALADAVDDPVQLEA